MPKNLMIATILGFTSLAHGAMWKSLGDKGHPNCKDNSCAVREGDASFSVAMTVEPQDGLDYLERIVIKNLATGKTQEFDTSAVSGTENHKPFELYAVNLQNPKTQDLALHAFDSAGAGPAYYYFVYDAKKKVFVQSPTTLAKLVWDGEVKTLKTEIQETTYKIENFKLVATGHPK